MQCGVAAIHAPSVLTRSHTPQGLTSRRHQAARLLQYSIRPPLYTTSGHVAEHTRNAVGYCLKESLSLIKGSFHDRMPRHPDSVSSVWQRNDSCEPGGSEQNVVPLPYDHFDYPSGISANLRFPASPAPPRPPCILKGCAPWKPCIQ